MKTRDNKLNTFAQIRELAPPKDMLFSCALMQRMLPNYQLFSELNDFGDGQMAQATLNLIWDWCMSSQSKFNAAIQIEKLEEIIPEVANFESFGVYPALDYCMALSCALQSFTKEHEHAAVTIAKLSQGSVEAYILATSETELSSEEIKNHPLMVFEIETQVSLLEFCQNNKMTKDLVKELRADLVAQKMSSLGIELE